MDPPQSFDSRQLSKWEYETQFFGFSSRALLVHLKDNINDTFSAHAKSLQDSIVNKRGADVKEAKSATDMWISKCESALKAHSDDLQVACDLNFGIPDGVLLPEDSAQRVQYSREEVENLDRELDSLMTRLTRAKAMNCHLSKELEDFEKLKPTIEKMNNLRLETLNTLVKKMTKQEQHMKRLSKVSKSISCVTRKTAVDKPDIPHRFIKDKFCCSIPEHSDESV